MNRTFLSGGVGAAAVRDGTEELLRGGTGWATCSAGILAFVGDAEGAARVMGAIKGEIRQSPCGKIADAVIAWRRGSPSAGLELLQGIDFASEKLYAGGMLLDLGRPEEALRALEKFDRQMVTWLPFYAWGAGEASYLRALALDRLGRKAEARDVVAEQLRVWAKADPANPALRRMRELAGRLKARTKG
jgi:hypothetical protein